MDSIRQAQEDMRNAYGNGSLGVLVSGAVWVAASLVVNYYSAQNGIWTLIIGGMFIFPLSILIDKLVGLRGAHDKNNPLGQLAMEGTIWMIACIPLAYGVSLIKSEWFFQGMLLIIAGRYLTFASLYGMRLYWLLGAALGAAAYGLFTLQANAFVSALTGGLTEIAFGIGMYALYRFDKKKNQ